MRLVLAALAVATALVGCATVPNGRTPTLLGQPPLQLNGHVLRPVVFPAAAWQGLSPVTSMADLRATGAAVAQLTAASQAALDSGNTPLAYAQLALARQLAIRAAHITEATMGAIRSLNSGTGRATIAPRATVILPTYEGGLDVRPDTGLLANLPAYRASIDLKDGVQVAGDITAAAETLRQLSAALNNGQQPSTGNRLSHTNSVDDSVMKEQLPLNTPVRLENGLIVERRNDALIAYNPNGAPVELDLKAINYLPPMPKPSETRQKAGPIMSTISDSSRQYFNDLSRQRYVELRVQAPNALVNVIRSTDTVWLDQFGRLTRDRSEGERAYKRDPVFKTAVDSVILAETAQEIRQYESACRQQGYGFYYSISGRYGEFVKKSCIKQNQPVYSKVFFLMEGSKEALQTYESLMQDKRTIQRLEEAYKQSADLSGTMGFVPWIGELENAAQCIGTDTAVQRVYMASRQGANWRDLGALAQNGWTPPREEQGAALRVANCLGAIPLAGRVVGKAAAAGIKWGGPRVAVIASQADHYSELFGVFGSNLRPSGVEEAVQIVGKNFPGNAGLVSFTKHTYDVLQNGNNMTQLVAGLPTAIAVAKETTQ